MKNSILRILSVFLIVSSIASAQPPVKYDSVKQKFIKAATEIMINAHFCTLISLDENGRPVGRIVEPFMPDKDLVIWMGTNSHSRKVEQIQKNPAITLFYFDNKTFSYISIQGRAQLVNDSLEKTRHWNEEWKPFYKNIQEDYLLIKFTPELLEILNPQNGFVGDKLTWKTPSLKFY